jgi:hypothetical protein
MIIVRELTLHGLACLYLDGDGYVAVAPPGEITLDALPETMAIQTLIDKGYNEEGLTAYLKGRDARLATQGDAL